MPMGKKHLCTFVVVVVVIYSVKNSRRLAGMGPGVLWGF